MNGPERDSDPKPAAAETAVRRTTGVDKATRIVAAAELLGPGGLLRIDLDGEIYTLRLTRNHRLILTK